MSSTTAHDDSHDLEDEAGDHHVDPMWLYLGVFGGLLVLTVVTVAASYVDFGSANTIIAVLIASMKAFLVAFFFMHLRHDKPFHSIVFVAGLLFLSFLFLFTLLDMDTRNDVDDWHGKPVKAAPTVPAGAAPGGHHLATVLRAPGSPGARAGSRRNFACSRSCATHAPAWHRQAPPQSMVFGRQSSVQTSDSQAGFAAAGTHERAWQHVAGTQSASERHSRSTGTADACGFALPTGCGEGTSTTAGSWRFGVGPPHAASARARVRSGEERVTSSASRACPSRAWRRACRRRPRRPSRTPSSRRRASSAPRAPRPGTPRRARASDLP